MRDFKLVVPTYYGQRCSEEIASGEMEEFGKPSVPVLIRRAGGIRIVLGTHDYDNYEKPDLLVERQPNGWAIFLHPLGGGDPSGYVYFLDDGRSFLVMENDPASDAAIVVLEPGSRVPEIDGPD